MLSHVLTDEMISHENMLSLHITEPDHMKMRGMHSLNPQVLLCGDSVLTHAVFHHHEATLVTFKALALKISRRVHAGARSAQVR